ncbi:MAG: FAD:protein FMN transferase [Jatrophihabitans sp.]
MSATYVGAAWSCTVRLVVADEQVLRPAAADLTDLLARVDAVASRFRGDSELSIANARAGRPTPVSKLLLELLTAALDAAARTDGAVDPTLGRAMRHIGYDRDIADLRDCGPAVPAASPSPGGWRRVRLHHPTGLLTVPLGVELDLGATGKAWTADRAAHLLATRYRTGVLVEIGGDVAVAGHRADGWTIRVAERAGGRGQLVRVGRGGITTSTTTVRTWTRGGATMHHLLDPATGEPANGTWRTVTVAAQSALRANTASTAAIVKGDGALAWLATQGLPARLVSRRGEVVTTPGWPSGTYGPDHVVPSAGDPDTDRRATRAPVNVIVARHSVGVGAAS